MKKSIKRFKILSIVIIALEAILIGLFCGFYFGNWMGFKNNIPELYYVIIAIGLVFLNFIFVLFAIARLSLLRRKTDLHAAEVIGSDVQEAYNFAMIGLAVTNEQDIVLWTNDLFSERHIDIIDSNILEWNPELEILKESGDKSVKVIINSRSYEVKLLQEAGLWIFKDVSDYEALYKFSKEQAPVVGIVSIDNYSDVVNDEEDSNDIVSRVKNEIFNYAKEYGLLLRRFKEGNYSLLCNYESFCKIKEDHFSVVDKVRNVSYNEDVPLTLSIGIAYDFPDVIKLGELASDALSTAMSRGGDQVAVNVYGKGMEFYGGKTEAQEKRNRVKIRVLADSLISLLKQSQNVIIMGHKNMDMDSLGACLGVKGICDRLGVPAVIACDLKITETKTRAAINSSFSKSELESMIVGEKEALSLLKSNSIVVVCDVHIQSMVMFSSLVDNASKLVVIDHHRRAEEFIDNPVFNHIDPAASSTCEIIAEFIRFSSINPRVTLTPTYATIMLAGIFLDSGYYKSKNTGIRTFEASTILKEFGADNSLADDLLKDDYEEYIEVHNIITTMKTPQNGIYYAVGDPKRIYDPATLAKASNLCLSMKGVSASFIIAKISNKEIRLSARSDGTINVQLIAEKLGGGGHFTSAAAIFEKSDLSVVETTLVEAINNYYQDMKTKTKHESEED